jgi:Zn-dependent protease
MTVEEKVIFFGCLFVAIILHEISHGVVALFFGDDTAKRSGRLTLNPIRHIDPFGSLILPFMLVVAGQGAFGWAKPVPVDPSKLRNPRRQMLFVGLAGPITNFVLMLIAAVTCRTMLQRWLADNPVRLAIGLTLTDMPSVIQIAFYFALANLLLGVLNLLPIPPLDGSSLIERALPRPWLPAWYRFRPYGLLVLFVLVFWTGLFGTILRPFEDALIHYVSSR